MTDSFFDKFPEYDKDLTRTIASFAQGPFSSILLVAPPPHKHQRNNAAIVILKRLNYLDEQLNPIGKFLIKLLAIDLPNELDFPKTPDFIETQPPKPPLSQTLPESKYDKQVIVLVNKLVEEVKSDFCNHLKQLADLNQ